MANPMELKQQIAQGLYDGAFTKLYGADEKIIAEQRARYSELIDRFAAEFGADRTVRLYSAPGRTEIGGNHTDHNNGVVLAGSVNLTLWRWFHPTRTMLCGSSPTVLKKSTMWT